MGAESRPWLLRGALLGVALAVAVIALVSMDDDEAAVPPTVEAVPARIVTLDELTGLTESSELQAYWAGPDPQAQLEVTQESSGNVIVRYLTGGAEAGSPGGFLTVGTYPLADPTAALDTAASAPGAIVRLAPDGTRVVSSESAPNSAYFASPDNTVQVEVYDPRPGQAMSLVLEGSVRPVSAG